MRKKSLVRRLIPWILTIAVIGGLGYLIYLLYLRPTPPSNLEPPVISYFEEEDAPDYVMENEYYTFSLDPLTTQFKLQEKGGAQRVWLSNPEGIDNDKVTYAGTQARDAMRATLYVTYTPNNGTDPTQIDNYTYSISRGGYAIEQLEDGSIKVTYSIGSVERKYKIPFVLTEERSNQIKELADAYDKENNPGKPPKTYKNKISNRYTAMITPEQWKTRDDKDQLYAMYPSIAEQPLRVLNSEGTKNKNKRELEEIMAAIGYDDAMYEEDQTMVAQKPDTTGPVFNVSMIYRLEGRDLVVEIPYEDIRYRENYPITYVSPLPMFGAAGPDEEGFLLVPEGGGAIIRYNNGKLSQNEYSANLYGWDYGLERKEAKVETESAFPVFGATKGDASFICIMEGASSYASVYGDIGGQGHKNGFNTVYARYYVLHAAEYSVSNKTGKRVYVYEARIPNDRIKQRYRFIDSSSYVDMANAYGDYLLQNNDSLAEGAAGEETPVNVELVGAINKKVVKAGIPVDSVVATTTFDQAKTILDELADSGIKGLSVRMTGWSNGGVRQKVLTSVRVLNELGGENGMKALIDEARSKNVDLYFDGITCFAYNSGLAEGFVPFTNSARYATRDLIHLYPYNIVTYLPADFMDDYYLVKPSFAQQNATNLIRSLQSKKAAGIAFRDIGNLLSADYNPDSLVTREQVKQMNIGTMTEASAAGMKVMIKEGNEYALPYADRITDMDLTGQSYSILDERIPFYQIAIHGMKDFTGKPINLSGDYVTMLLECAEYGAGLNFTFMAEDTRILQDSVYSNYTASGYSFWKEEAIPMITRYQSEVGGLNRQRITGHERLCYTEQDEGTADPDPAVQQEEPAAESEPDGEPESAEPETTGEPESAETETTGEPESAEPAEPAEEPAEDQQAGDDPGTEPEKKIRNDSEVTVTTYADGTKVFVNYGSEDATVIIGDDGSMAVSSGETEPSAKTVTVPARDYLVERGDGQ